MRSHPELGVKIIESLGLFDGITDWVLYHHERIDGKGYYKLKGPDIPLASRIIAIADTYSAITMKRAYEDAKTHEEAVRIIREVAGTQLDPVLVDDFTAIPKCELENCRPQIWLCSIHAILTSIHAINIKSACAFTDIYISKGSAGYQWIEQSDDIRLFM